MNSALPEPARIAEHYNELMRDIGGEYIHSRWGDSEIKRRHYRQTETSLRHSIESLPRIGDVLEIGCGPAVWTPIFLPAAESVHLFDISAEMLAKARQRAEAWDEGQHTQKLRYTCGDFCDTEVERTAYDTIISARAFEYMSDKSLFVNRCHEALRPGGSLVLVTKNRAWRDMRPGRERMSERDLPVSATMQNDLVSWNTAVDMFDRAGFRDVQARPVVFGSYRRPFTSRPGLMLADLIHRTRYQRAMTHFLEGLVESYVVTGTRAST